MDNNFYQQPSFNTEEPMTLGNWMITLLLTMIPCVGFIMLLVWSFGSGTSTTKKNYARATLIFMLIFAVLGVIFSAAVGASAAAILAQSAY